MVFITSTSVAVAAKGCGWKKAGVDILGGKSKMARNLLLRTFFSSTPRKVKQHQVDGYQSIGSFHSDNLSEVLAIPDEDYIAPSLPFVVNENDDTFSSIQLDNNSKDDFLLDLKNWTFLNHGAFGGALRIGYYRAEAWRRYLEEQPLRYFDRDLLPHLAHSTRSLSKFVNAPSRSNIALLNNVTSGLNAILAGHARTYKDSAHCILWDTSYGSVKKMARHYYKNNNTNEPSVSEIAFQTRYLDRLASSKNPEEVFQEALDDFMSTNQKIIKDKNVLLLLDHTTSNTALTMPISKLAKQMKENYNSTNALVVVDGAHGLLAQDLDLSNLFNDGMVDMYLTNGHKWLSAPRGVAMMALSDYASREYKDTILRQPAIISHGVDEMDLLSRYVWDGCRDYSAALSIPSILDYWNKRNPQTVRIYCKALLHESIEYLAKQWHDEPDPSSWPGRVILADIDSSLLSPMALVRLPPKINDNQQKTSADSKRIQDYLYYQHKIEVPIKSINNQLYVRLSCHIYNSKEQYQDLGKAINEMSLL